MLQKWLSRRYASLRLEMELKDGRVLVIDKYSSNNICPICFKGIFGRKINYDSHAILLAWFHDRCIIGWLWRNNRCPSAVLSCQLVLLNVFFLTSNYFSFFFFILDLVSPITTIYVCFVLTIQCYISYAADCCHVWFDLICML